MGRFISADAFVSTGQGLLGNNMFAYCHNNSINYYDKNGQEPVSISLFAIAGITICCIALVYLGANALAEFIEWISRQCSYSTVGISYASEEETEETLPPQGQVSEDPEAPPVDAGKQGKHVPGHNNYDDSKSSWPEGQNGVSQTQEAWQNGVPDPKVPSGNVKIGISSDGTVVRVHIDGKGFIHGYPLYPTYLP